MIEDQHERSLEIVNYLIPQVDPKNVKTVYKFLYQLNKGAALPDLQKIKTIILMDATGSMYNTLSKAKNSVITMF